MSRHAPNKNADLLIKISRMVTEIGKEVQVTKKYIHSTPYLNQQLKKR